MAKKTENKTEKIEREYVIPLREKCRPVARYKKTNKAIKTIKEFLVRHMKIYDGDLNKIKIDKYLNETIWKRGIKNPPHKIKVKVVKDGEKIIVTAAELPKKIGFKKARHEKREKAAEEVKQKKKSMMQKAQETMAGGTGAKKEEVIEEKPEEKKIEEKEKAAAVKETTAKQAKAKATETKHTTKTNMKQSKRPVRKTMTR